MKKHDEDKIVALLVVVIMLVVGFITGWSVRVFTVKDRVARATAEKTISEACFYEQYTEFLKSRYVTGRRQ